MSMPVFPHNPALEKECVLGRSRFCVLASLYFSSALRHLSYSFSSMDCEDWRSFSLSLVMILDLLSLGWLI